MSVRVRLACGCAMTVDGTVAPACPVHGETRVVGVKAPAPKITAVGCKASGPLVTQKE